MSDDQVTLLLADDTIVVAKAEILRRHCRYFAALLDSSFAEATSRRITLRELHADSVKALIQSFAKNSSLEECLWADFDWKVDGPMVLQVADYLQVDDESLLSAMDLLTSNGGSVREECRQQGWLDEQYHIVAIPSGKKKRTWRFWVCFLLCLDIFPHVDENMDQLEFMQRLTKATPVDTEPVALRRELIEYGLLCRQDDGSAYWRPQYTLAMLRQWMEGIPSRRVI